LFDGWQKVVADFFLWLSTGGRECHLIAEEKKMNERIKAYVWEKRELLVP